MELHHILGGALVGFIVGATGVGGGSLMTPLLRLGIGVSAPEAVGTDLLFAGLTKAGGAVAHARRGSVSWPLPTLLVGVLIGALVTMTSVGAGVLGVVALYFLYPRLPVRQIVGADIARLQLGSPAILVIGDVVRAAALAQAALPEARRATA